MLNDLTWDDLSEEDKKKLIWINSDREGTPHDWVTRRIKNTEDFVKNVNLNTEVYKRILDEEILDILDNLSAFNGGLLPEITINYSSNPAVGYVDTWIPGTTDPRYTFIGHSQVILPSVNTSGKRWYTADFDTPGYNLIYNNCSDFSIAPLLFMTLKPKESLFFNTPGDTRDFIKENYTTRDVGNKNLFGYSTYEFDIPLEQLHRLKQYLDLERIKTIEYNRKKRFNKLRIDAITY